jgi:chromosome segregation ATPase
MLRRLDAVDGAIGECPTVLWGSPRRRASRRRHRRGADRDSTYLSRTGHDHERKLIKKVKDLNGEIVNNASKVHTALKLSQDDQQTITTLRSEVEKAWKMVDTAQSKETSAKETITSLKEEIANLSGLVEKSAALTGTQEGMVQELTAARDELQRQTEEATGTCKVLETQLTNITEVLEAERLESATLRGDKADLEQSLAARSAEVQRGQRSKERLDKELKNTLKLLEARTGEQEALTAEATEAKAHGKELETQLNDARNTMDKYLRDYDTLYQRTQKLTEDLEGAAPVSVYRRVDGVGPRRCVRGDAIAAISV